MSAEQEKTDSKTVDSPWARSKNCDSKTLRQPNLSSAESEGTSSKATVQSEEKDMVKDIDDIVVKSQLNINAAEFVPRSHEINDSTELVIDYLRQELNWLTISPGEYDDISKEFCSVIKPYANDATVLKFVTNTIIDGCISDSNVCYPGARLCNDLSKLCDSNFRSILLSSCEEEYEKFKSNPCLDDADYINRICGFGLMLAELFLQIQVCGKSIVALGKGLLDILQTILLRENERTIKFVCQILKLTGVQLEELDESSSNKLNELFSRLQTISQYPDIDPNLQFTIANLNQMRNSNWSQRRDEQPSTEVSEVNYNDLNGPVFFGPDGKVVTEEETNFLHENLPLSDDKDDYVCEQDEMDEEMSKAYEEFLKMSKSEKMGSK